MKKKISKKLRKELIEGYESRNGDFLKELKEWDVVSNDLKD